MTDTHHPSIFAPFLGEDGQVVIGNRPVGRWLDNSGRPHFLYSKSRLATRIAELRAAMPRDLHLHYAVKSNPFAPLLQAVDPLVDGFDIASIGELRQLIAAGCSVDNVSFAGPGKSQQEIDEAAAHDVKIIVESPHQLRMCQKAGAELGRTVRAMVRINDQKARPGGGLSMAGGNTVFGWDLADFLANGRGLFGQSQNVEFWGLHLFFGSQILQSTAIEAGISASVETIKSMDLPDVPRLVNLGGGLGVPYGPKDAPLDIRTLTPVWDRAVNDLKTLHPDTNVCIELGRYISATTGLYVMDILDKKQVGDASFLVCAGGLHHFAAATGNFGQVLKRDHPVAVAHADSGPTQTVTIAGPLCTPMDVFARNIELPNAEIGDRIVVFQAGAYGATASPTGFLSHPPAVERMVD